MNVKTLNTTSLDGDVVVIKKGGSSQGGGSNWRYYDVSALQDKTILFEIVLMCKLPNVIGGMVLAYSYGVENVTAVGFDVNAKVTTTDVAQTYGEVWEQLLPQFTQAGVTEITEEEFYTLE